MNEQQIHGAAQEAQNFAYMDGRTTPPEAALIAASDLIKQLRAELAEMTELAAHNASQRVPDLQKIEKLEAENDRLRAGIKESIEISEQVGGWGDPDEVIDAYDKTLDKLTSVMENTNAN
jgi:hypothetical protein